MATVFYAIILDWELARPPKPQVRLVATDASAAALGLVVSYDPAGPFTTINTADFSITQQTVHPIANQYTNNANPAHICKVTL